MSDVFIVRMQVGIVRGHTKVVLVTFVSVDRNCAAVRSRRLVSDLLTTHGCDGGNDVWTAGGIDSIPDRAQLSVATITEWWQRFGRQMVPCYHGSRLRCFMGHALPHLPSIVFATTSKRLSSDHGSCFDPRVQSHPAYHFLSQHRSCTQQARPITFVVLLSHPVCQHNPKPTKSKPALAKRQQRTTSPSSDRPRDYQHIPLTDPCSAQEV